MPFTPEYLRERFRYDAAREAAERKFGFHTNHGMPANDNAPVVVEAA